MRTSTFPKRSFEDMDVEAIAAQIEKDIKAKARKWRYNNPNKRLDGIEVAATETAALYLQANHDLYFRDDRQAMRDAHAHWMHLMRTWFIQTVERKRKYQKAT